jgi:hypothetical protein
MPDNDELRISISRLAPTWSQTEIITDVPTSLETFLVPNSQDKCQCCEVAAERAVSGACRLNQTRIINVSSSYESAAVQPEKAILRGKPRHGAYLPGVFTSFGRSSSSSGSGPFEPAAALQSDSGKSKPSDTPDGMSSGTTKVDRQRADARDLVDPPP